MGTTGDSQNKSIKRPHRIKTLLFDRYWKNYFEAWNNRAQQVYEKKYELLGQKFQLSDEDDEAIERLYELHLTAVEAYRAACSEKNVDSARDYIERIRQNTNNMDDVTKASERRARNAARLAEGYQKILRRMAPLSVLDHGYHFRGACNLFARRDPVTAMINWFGGVHKERRIFWLRGQPNSGKSVLLRHVTRKCVEAKTVMAGFVFSQGFGRPALVDHFIPTILNEIARRLEPFQEALSKNCVALQDDNIFARPIKEQTQQLLVAAYSRMPLAARAHPFLIILDDVDNCDVAALDALFEFIKECLGTMPNFYLMISSRILDGESSVDSRLSPLKDSVEEATIKDIKTAYEEYIASLPPEEKK